MDRMVVSVLIVAAGLSMLTSCNRYELEDDKSESVEEERGSMKITFDIPQWQPTMIVTMDSLGAGTRGDITADGKAMTDLWILDYKDDVLANSIHQASGDEDFASPELDMEFGEHTIYFVASRGGTPTISTENHTIVWEKPSDTFYKAVTLTVSRGTAAAQTVTMDRVAARLVLEITDQVPANADRVIINPSTWYYGIDFLTGNGVASSDADKPITVPDDYKATDKRLQLNYYCLTPAATYTTDIQIRCVDTDDATIASYTLTDVQMQRNHKSVYSGELFSTSGSRGFLLTIGDAEWGEDIIGTW